ncbi:MAG: restriction endonuclease subunit S [Chitinophagales bacterium]|nr:restriction endonuclease subunit S [Chitinophagales bacterium]
MKFEKLKNIVEVKKGKKPSFVETPDENSIRVLQIDDLRNNTNPKFTNDKTGVLAKEDDVLIAWDGANAGTIGYGKSGYIGSTIALLRKKQPDLYSTTFIGIFLQSQYQYLRSKTTGATIPHISRKALDELEVPVISVSDQLHIATTLSKAENLIAQRKESIRLLDEFLKSTFLEMFGDPVRNEKGWEVYPFSELVADDCPLTYGIVQPGNEFPNGVPVIRPVDLTKTIITRQGLKLIDPKISEQFKRTVLKGGELLMCVRGTTGVVSIASSELAGCNVTRGITPIWFSDNYNSLFAYGLFQTQAVKNRIQELTYGATLKQINLGDLRKIKLINPPIQLQTQFARIVEKTEALTTQYQQSLQELENLYGSLSQKAFKGELTAKQNSAHP